MTDAPKTIWAWNTSNCDGDWTIAEGQGIPYTLTSSVAAQLKAADELANAVNIEAVARGNYLGTKRDRGGNSGPKGKAEQEWFASRCRLSDALTAYRKAKEAAQ